MVLRSLIYLKLMTFKLLFVDMFFFFDLIYSVCFHFTNTTTIWMKTFTIISKCCACSLCPKAIYWILKSTQGLHEVTSVLRHLSLNKVIVNVFHSVLCFCCRSPVHFSFTVPQIISLGGSFLSTDCRVWCIDAEPIFDNASDCFLWDFLFSLKPRPPDVTVFYNCLHTKI